MGKKHRDKLGADLFAKKSLDIKIVQFTYSVSPIEISFMARKPPKSKSVAFQGSQEDLPEDVLEAVAQVDSLDNVTRGKTMSKSAAARAAIDEGYETPALAVPYIKSRYGVSMGPQHFSAVKSQYKQQQATQASADAESSFMKKNSTASRPLPSSTTKKGGSSSHTEPGLLEALEGVKELVGQYGVDQVKRMVDLLG